MATPVLKVANSRIFCKVCHFTRYACTNVPTQYVKRNVSTSKNCYDSEQRRPLKGDSFHTTEEVDDTSGYKSSQYDQLYPGHIPTTLFQKCLLAGGSGVTAFFKPWRDDMVHYFGETTSFVALKGMRDKMLEDPVGRQILEERPRINNSTIDLDYLSQLPDGTLGREYVTFLEKYKLSPDDRLGVSFIDDAELAYTLTRYREVHDLVHTVLGMPTNMLGEVVVKWVEGIQTGLPMCFLGAMFSPLRFGPVYRQRYLTTYWAWALRVGMQSRMFLNIYFERHWEENLEDLRKEWNIEAPPIVKKG